MRKLLPALLALGAIVGSTGVAHAGGNQPESFVVHVGVHNVATGVATGVTDSGPYSYSFEPDGGTLRSKASWDGASGFAIGTRIAGGRSDGAGYATIGIDVWLAEDDNHTYYRLADVGSRVSCPLEGAEFGETLPVTVQANGVSEVVTDHHSTTITLRDGRTADVELEKVVDQEQLRGSLILPFGAQHAAAGWLMDVQVSDGGHYRYLAGVTYCWSQARPEPPVGPAS